MKTVYRYLLLFILSFNVIAFKALAQHTGTIYKLITGPGNTAVIHFQERILPYDTTIDYFNIGLKVLDDTDALQIEPPIVDSVIGWDFVITGLKTGKFRVEVTYTKLGPTPEIDTEYVTVEVLKNYISPTDQGQNILHIVPMHLFDEKNLTASKWIPFIYTKQNIYQYNYDTHEWEHFWTAPEGRKIAGISEDYDLYEILLIVLDNGEIYESFNESGWGFDEPQSVLRIGLEDDEYIYEILGDAFMYILTNRSIYFSSDTGRGWGTVQLGILIGLQLYKLALDSSENVYVAISNGLYRARIPGNDLTKITTLPEAPYSVFIDRRDRIYTASVNLSHIFMSTNRGTTWIQQDSIAFEPGYVSSFGDDSYGNIYAILGSRILKSAGGTGPWVDITASLGVNSGMYIHAIRGDSTLFLATNFGMYLSTDQGTTWTEANKGLPAVNIYSLINNTDGTVFLSTDRGIYQGIIGSSSWTKRYPVNGFMNALQEGGVPLFSDNDGTLYVVELSRKHAFRTPLTYKSTDNGLTWQPDTSGYSIVPLQMGVFYVDHLGVQHFAVVDSNVLKLYVKAPGESWTSDELGYSSGGLVGQPYAFCYSRNGSLYFSQNIHYSSYWPGLVWKQTGGTWTLDTNGLQGAHLFQLTGGRANDLYGCGKGIFHLTDSGWKTLSYPSGEWDEVTALSVDSSGALFASFVTYPNVQNTYFTTNNGKSWVASHLRGVSVHKLVSYGDTTYALTDRGLYYLTREGTAAVRLPYTKVEKIVLAAYPNPSSDKTTIEVISEESGTAEISIVDILGKKIADIFNGKLDNGKHTFIWNSKNNSFGIYTCMVRIGTEIQTIPIVLSNPLQKR